jgi:hypothetical protein
VFYKKAASQQARRIEPEDVDILVVTDPRVVFIDEVTAAVNKVCGITVSRQEAILCSLIGNRSNGTAAHQMSDSVL